jgi:hypothetical protein
MSSKTRFRNTFKLMNGERPVFVPFVYGLAAKMEQLPLEDMVTEAGEYSHAVEGAFELFGYDGIVTGWDSTLEAEAFGAEVDWTGDYAPPQIGDTSGVGLREVEPAASPRIAAMLEATRRIVMTRGKDTAIIGTVTGPVSLVHLLAEGAGGVETLIPLAGNLLMKVVKGLCELRVDAVFIREDVVGAGYRESLTARQAPFAAIYSTLFNLVRHYNGFPVLVVREMEPDFIPDLHRLLAPSGLALLGKGIDDAYLAKLYELSSSLKLAFGLPLPVGDVEAARKQHAAASAFIGGHMPTGFFYVSDGEVPHDTPPDNLHDLMAEINSGE